MDLWQPEPTEMNKQNDVLANNPISDVKLTELLLEIAKSHGIDFVASPESWDGIDHSDSSPSISEPIEDYRGHNTLLPLDIALNGGSPEFASFLLYEVQTTLCDAGFDYAAAECAITINDEGLASWNRESTIPLSVFLYSTDRTFESLSKLMSPDFYDGSAISTAWFARSLATVKGQPQQTLNNTISLSMG